MPSSKKPSGATVARSAGRPAPSIHSARRVTPATCAASKKKTCRKKSASPAAGRFPGAKNGSAIGIKSASAAAPAGAAKTRPRHHNEDHRKNIWQNALPASQHFLGPSRAGPARDDPFPVTPPPAQLVWFKRDLRTADHLPLTEAARRGPLVCLYVYEAELLASPEFTAAHLVFINQALEELDQNLRARGAALVIRRGAMTEVLGNLHRETGFTAIWSHEETGNDLTFRRDGCVADWCRTQGVAWHQHRQDGVVRRLRSRNGWSQHWQQLMNRPLAPAPQCLVSPAAIASDGLRTPESLGLGSSDKPDAQRGGESEARRTLASFLTVRGENYRTAMSSPVEGWAACSRLSPYFATGCLSLRTATQAAERCRTEVRSQPETDRRWRGSLQSFGGRLRWHCHFMQKLEDEPRIEFTNFVRAYDGLREEFTASAEGRARFEAWRAGRTGYPMVDACLRCVQATGWLNFRMRAMLASFSAYHLWLHWREPAVWLGAQFLDFEPGIHFSQFQMQSGTSGINTIRIYSPAKQAADHDPHGLFIRRWVPELAGVPDSWLPAPEKMPSELQNRAGCRIGPDYPAPVVDHTTAVREARARLAEVRRRTTTREEARRVFVRHGSRRRPPARRSPHPPRQPDLPGFA